MRKLILQLGFCFLAITATFSINGQVKLIAPTMVVEKDDLIEVDVTVEEFEEIVSMQFSMHYDPEVLEYKTVNNFMLEDLTINQIGEPTNANIGLGNITVVWIAPDVINGVEVDDEDPIFTIVFEVIGEAGEISPLTFDGNPTAMEVINASGEANYVMEDGSVTIDQMNATHEIHTKDFTLYQNTPNPFQEKTIIQFNLNKASDATLTVYDVTGKVVHEVYNQFNSGMNAIEVNRRDLNGAGNYFYKLVTEDASATQSLILVK